MKDRVPLYPGRVKLTPVSGQANTYDMVRADEPTQEGTPLSKATFLNDTTAALFGLGASAVPNDVFNVLSRFQNGLGNEYVWEKTEDGYEFDHTTTGPGMLVDFISYPDVSYSDTLIVENGQLALLNPTTISVSLSSDLSVFTGKFIRVQSGSASYSFYKILEGHPLYFSSNQYLRADLYEQYTSGRVVATVLGYVNSPDPNAYPPAVSDGYTYMALGQLGNKVQIATGSYTGTGTYGSSNPNSLTFDFEPKMLFISGNGGFYYALLNSGVTTNFFLYSTGNETPSTNNNYGSKGRATISGNTISWYGSDATSQANNQTTFYYFAIG